MLSCHFECAINCLWMAALHSSIIKQSRVCYIWKRVDYMASLSALISQWKNCLRSTSSICISSLAMNTIQESSSYARHYRSIHKTPMEWMFQLYHDHISHRAPSSHEILISVCLQKDINQYCDATKLDCTICSGQHQELSSEYSQKPEQWVQSSFVE